MSVLTDSFDHVRLINPENDGPELTHTSWGYMITSHDAAGFAVKAGYSLMRYFGIVLILVAVGLWVLPGTSVHAEVMPFKIGLSVLFAVLGGISIWNSANDRREEAQLDLERCEFRRGIRHANGRFAVLTKLALKDAGELFVSRPSHQGEDAVLYLRRANAPQALEVASGPEDLLFPLLQRITSDLNRVIRPSS